MSTDRKRRLWFGALAIASAFGVIGGITGEARYSGYAPGEAVEVTRALPDGLCKIKRTAVLNGRVFNVGTNIGEVSCREIFVKLLRPEEILEYSPSQEIRTYSVIPTRVTDSRERAWVEEVASRGLRFVTAGLFGLALVALIVSARTIVQIVDFRFDRLHAIPIIKFLYIASTTAIAIGAVLVVYTGVAEVENVPGSDEDFYAKALIAAVAPLVAVLLWLVVRLIFESALVRFRVSEDLREIRKGESF